MARARRSAPTIRNPNAGALPVAAGMTTSDITSQMTGPYTAATASAPPNRATVRRNATNRVSARMNTADHTKATKRCSASPAATPRAPISNMRGPNGTDATPCQNRLNVEPYARMPSRLAHTKSHAAVTSQVTTIAAAMLLFFTVAQFRKALKILMAGLRCRAAPETDDVAVGVLDVEVLRAPRRIGERLEDRHA